MKKMAGNWLVGLLLASGTSSAWAQTVPPGLIDNLRVVGIQKWEVMLTNVAYVKEYPAGAGIDVLAYALSECGSSDATPCYIIKMTVSIENVGDANVLLKDPQLDVLVVQPVEKGEVLATSQDKSELYKGTNAPMSEKVVKLGKARLVHETSMTWEPIANIKCSEGAQKATETQQLFEVIVGPRDLEHAQRLIDAFNIMNSQDRRWSLLLRGTAKVGWQNKGSGESTAMVFSSSPVEIRLQSRPRLPEQIPFPR
jgi:hypothetical protein